jgi:hypothetical protein
MFLFGGFYLAGKRKSHTMPSAKTDEPRDETSKDL